jgi:Flp pilus assembly protein TadD
MIRTVSLLTVVIICTAFILAGCAEPQSTNQGRYMPTEVKSQQTQSSEFEEKYENPQRHYELGQLYRQDKRWVQAESEYSVALQFEPGHKQAQAAMVKMNIERGDKDASKVLADSYISQSAYSAEALMLLGKAFMIESLDEYAYECFDKASAIAPDYAAVYTQLGYYYNKKGDAARAEEAFKKSFQLDPYDAQVAGELGKMGVVVEVKKRLN